MRTAEPEAKPSVTWNVAWLEGFPMVVLDGFAIDLERRTAVHLQHRHTFTFNGQSGEDSPTPTYWWIFDRTDASPRELIAAATAAYRRALGGGTPAGAQGKSL